jgi:hypothetical protein
MEKEIVENLWNGDSEAQIQAAMELSRLCNKQKLKLAENGVMVPLVSMLHSENYEVIEASLCAFLSLSFGSDRLVHSLSPLIFCINFLHFFLVKFPDRFKLKKPML